MGEEWERSGRGVGEEWEGVDRGLGGGDRSLAIVVLAPASLPFTESRCHMTFKRRKRRKSRE